MEAESTGRRVRGPWVVLAGFGLLAGLLTGVAALAGAIRSRTEVVPVAEAAAGESVAEARASSLVTGSENRGQERRPTYAATGEEERDGVLAAETHDPPSAAVQVLVRGRVSDEDGGAAVGVPVIANWRAPGRMQSLAVIVPGIANPLQDVGALHRSATTSSGEDGTYEVALELPRPAEDEELVVTVEIGERADVTGSALGMPGARTSRRVRFAADELVRDDVDFVQETTGAVRGRFVLADGSPVGRAGVRVLWILRGGSREFPRWLPTDPAGEFELDLGLDESLRLGTRVGRPVVDPVVNRFAERRLDVVRLELVVLDRDGRHVPYDTRYVSGNASDVRSHDDEVHYLETLPAELRLRAGKRRATVVVTEDDVVGSRARLELLLEADLEEYAWDPALGRPMPTGR